MFLSKLSSLFNYIKCKRVVIFHKYLLVTNVSISVTLSGVGDVIQQKYLISRGIKKEIDVLRTRNMAISGLPVGVLCHYWYSYLDLLIPERTFKAVMKKVVVDQVLASPVFIFVFFLTVGLLERTTFESIVSESVRKGWRMYAAEWMIWPPAQVINFYLLPLQYRVLYDNLISLGFDIYTSYIKHDLEDE